MSHGTAIEARLQRWAEAVTIGDASGYATVCTLHESWSPPAAGQRPTLKVSAASDVRETHRAIGQLSLRLRNAIVVRYCFGGTIEEQAAHGVRSRDGARPCGPCTPRAAWRAAGVLQQLGSRLEFGNLTRARPERSRRALSLLPWTKSSPTCSGSKRSLDALIDALAEDDVDLPWSTWKA